MGDAGTWTVFVYMCGSDLESDGGMASADIEEMEKSSAGGNVKFVVQTGGAYYWENDVDEDGDGEKISTQWFRPFCLVPLGRLEAEMSKWLAGDCGVMS